MDNEFSIEVKNFGPISEVEFKLNKLTIFIGPNNTGKSYSASLVHLFCKELSEILSESYDFSDSFKFGSTEAENESLKDFRKIYLELSRLSDKAKDLFGINYDEIIDGKSVSISQKLLQVTLQVILETITKKFERRLNEEFKRIFSCKPEELIKFGTKRLQISIKSNILLIKIKLKKKKIFIEEFSLKPPNLKIFKNENRLECEILTDDGEVINISRDMDIFKFILRNEKLDPSFEIMVILFEGMKSYIKSQLNIVDNYKSFYIPGTRSGLIQSHKAVASAFLRLSSKALIEPLDIPTLPGLISDFLVNIVEISKKEELFPNLIKILEDEILKGRIELISDKTGVGNEIFYITPEGSISLGRVSSMITELAPIILYFKYIIRNRCFLVIEEPEAHLHPDAQIKFAKFIIRLIRDGFRLLITTHSDHLIYQLNNFIKLSIKKEKIKLNYNELDYIHPSELNVYLFKKDEITNGVVSKKLEINEFGIVEDHFAQITDELYGESAEIDRIK
ncbi:MAG: hypothetical protein CEE42_14945 [Promethearchaeota archaeon Loki_b31]|nr:MAG: hypothetical protein CEE42_14945 [Candidatus Lokiarchaeota archaeon Loki_b31]